MPAWCVCTHSHAKKARLNEEERLRRLRIKNEELRRKEEEFSRRNPGWVRWRCAALISVRQVAFAAALCFMVALRLRCVASRCYKRFLPAMLQLLTARCWCAVRITNQEAALADAERREQAAVVTVNVRGTDVLRCARVRACLRASLGPCQPLRSRTPAPVWSIAAELPHDHHHDQQRHRHLQQ